MLFNMNKKVKTASAKENLAPDQSVFVPYYCHYNPHTLLTKNGEVMQTIKIDSTLGGLNYEGAGNPASAAREMIRAAITKHIETDDVAIWLHVLRKRRPIENRGKYKESFASAVHERWQKKHLWKYEYYNEIYVSVLYNGQSAKLFDTKHLKHTILPSTNNEFRNNYLDLAAEALDGIVDNMMKTIGEHFSCVRLGLAERVPTNLTTRQTIFYSEPMEFLGTLLNLRDDAFPLPQMDLSDALFNTTPTFGFNALETKNDEGKRRFGAMLALKQYREVPAETMDRLLQAPMELMISQAFHFIPSAGALMPYKQQKEYFEISGDTYSITASGIDDMMATPGEEDTDFGDHQTSIMVLADEFKALESEIVKAQDAFSDLGLITVREDLKLEECFWAQLPGNFEFLRRRDTINTRRIAGFCRLNRYPHGRAEHNHWGDAVTLLPTLVKSPYFFNFHDQDNGHTVMLDFNSFNDQFGAVLTNFLLTEARKFDGRTYIFDRGRSADLYFQKMGGHYHDGFLELPDANRKPLALNPFSLEGTASNQSFLLAWCNSLISPHLRLPEAQKDILRSSIAELYEGAPEQRHLGGLVEIVAGKDAPLAEAFAPFRKPGKYAGLFDHYKETLDLKTPLHAFDMDMVSVHKDLTVSVFAYLIHRIVSELDGKPTIIVLHEAWDLIENGFIAPRIESLMEILKQKNAILLFTTSKPAQAVGTHTFDTIMKGCASHLIIPDDIARNYVDTPAFSLSEQDNQNLADMRRQDGDFMLRQGDQVVGLRADLRAMDDVYVIFSNDIKNLGTVMGKFANVNPDNG